MPHAGAPAGDAEQPNNCAKIMFDRISARRALLPSNGSTVTCIGGVAARRSTFRQTNSHSEAGRLEDTQEDVLARSPGMIGRRRGGSA
jgi:hypothetical protein